GSVDTLNAYVGWVRDLQKKEEIKEKLENIQRKLLTNGALLAVDPDREMKMKLPEMHPQDIEELEEEIDKMEQQLPTLRSFILPGGHEAVSACHIARCHCREAERNVVALEEAEKPLPAYVLPFLNRLSDYFFELARWTAKALEVEEKAWIGRKSR